MADSLESRGRGRGRGQGRGRPRGRASGVGGRGRQPRRALQFGIPHPTTTLNDERPSTSTGPPQPATSLGDEIKKMKLQDKRHENLLSHDQRLKLKKLRDAKQVAQFLMPDAPAKNKRKVSPVRIPCPLKPGTPEITPPYIPQPWELKIKNRSTPTPRISDVNDPPAPTRAATPNKTIDEMSPSEKSNIVLDTPPPKKIRRNPNLTPSTGVVRAEGSLDTFEVLDAKIEFVGFSPSSSATPSTSGTPTMSKSGTASETPIEPSLFDNLLFEEDLQRWEASIGQNPGSDLDPDDIDEFVDFGTSRRRMAGDFPEDAYLDLPPDVARNLELVDQADNAALRELASEDLLHFEWSSDPNVFTGQRETFTGQPGPTFDTSFMSPMDILSKILDEDICNLICRETNRYAQQLQVECEHRYARINRWQPITPQELWVFFAVVMLQSIFAIAVEKDYWYPSLPYIKIGQFGDFISFHRFQLIKRCLHFIDNSTLTGNNDKLAKIQPVIDHLNLKFSSLYLPGQEIAIDESLLLWKGRLSFAQLINNKAARVGVKSFELCESSTGYLWKMIVYSGKDGEKTVEAGDAPDNVEPQGAISQIVYKLVSPLLNLGHTLVMDNYYNSPLLSRTLKKLGRTDTMGTIRLNREFVPESLKCKNKLNMRTGEVTFSQTSDLSITVWKDANVVSLISTFQKIEVGGKEKHGYYKFKPQVVLDYNLSMGGIDKKDQMLQAFPVERIRNSIWYKKLFRRLLNVAIHNSFVIYKTSSPSITSRQFRLRLADEIIQKFRPPKIAPPLVTGHFPVRNTKKAARCKFCYQNKINACTVWMCEACNVNLCILGCFKKFHSQ